MYYTRQMFDTTSTYISNNKIIFSQNSDSIKWIDNGVTKVNSLLTFVYDTSFIALGNYTNKLKFANQTTNFTFGADYFDFKNNYLTLIDANTKKMYFLYK